MDNICGSTDTDTGEPCQRTAGWGTESDMGECRDHATEYTVPDKLTPDVRERLLGAAARGAMLKHCAMAAGITARTLRNWLSEGQEHAEDGIETPLSGLYFRFQRARGEGIVSTLSECSPQFVAERSFGYTKTERHEFDLDPPESDNGDPFADINALLNE